MTQEELKEILNYDPGSGVFTWARARGRAPKGSVAGTISVHGYNIITIDGQKMRAARLAWLWMTGNFPPIVIDHKNRNKTDDRWENLRLATHSENTKNRLPKTQSPGIYWHKGAKKWAAQICNNGENFYLGLHAKKKDALKAYRSAAKRLHGEYRPSKW